MKLHIAAHRLRRRLAAIIGIGFVTAMLAACGGNSNADAVGEDGTVDLSEVTLTVGDQKGGSQALLKAAGELDEVEYDVEWKPFTSGPPLLDALAGGSVDVGGVGNTPPLFAINESKKLKIVQASKQGARGDALVVPKDSKIGSVEELEGKKVAVAKGSSANYNLLAQLEKVGLSFDDIKAVYLQPSEALAAFKGGHVDAWAIWDPFTSQAELDAGARVLSDGEGLVNGLAFQVASDEAVNDKATRVAISDYLSRLARAQIWANENRGAWAKTWAADTGLAPQVTKRAIARRTYAPIPVRSAVATEQQMWTAFKGQKQVSADIDISTYFSDDFDKAVLAAAKGDS